MIFFDTETIGYQGPIVLFQYAYDNEPIQLVNIWEQKVKEVIDLYETIVNHPGGIVGFNLSFDWFHICQQYTTLRLIENKDKILKDCIEEYVDKEPLGRDGPCLKPHHVLDLFLHAKKTKYQSLMDRKDIKVRKVPTVLSYQLVKELEKRVKLKSIYFARKTNKYGPQWGIYEIKNSKNDDFKNVMLKFAASSGLKALAIDTGIEKESIINYDDLIIKMMPKEYGWAPFAKAVPGYKINSWMGYLKLYCDFWYTNKEARSYAEKDVDYTRSLYDYFGRPELDDDDSILSCLVAAVRWKGFKIDIKKIKMLRDELRMMIRNENIPIGYQKAQQYIAEGMDATEKAIFLEQGSTNKIILKEISKWIGDSDDINNKPIRHKAAIRASKVLEARDAKYDIGIYNKLLQAGRLHAALKVIGTLSGRMAGDSDLNVHGFKRTKKVRSCFPLAFNDDISGHYILSGGDFESFEVAIAAAAYDDPRLNEDLCKCWKCGYDYKPEQFLLKHCPNPDCGEKDSRQKIHALFAMDLFPGNDYEAIIRSKGTVTNSMYDLGKNGVFSMVYGGTEYTLTVRYGIPAEIALEGKNRFIRRYSNIGRSRQKTFTNFCSMTQPGGIGSRVIWKDPADYIESMLGFRRYFTLENQICKALFNLANDPPKQWKDLKIPVVRRDRVQYVSGAVQSALYGAAFAIQAYNMRAAENHRIQSTGAIINKRVQVAIWEKLQPKGIHEFNVLPLNIHDEIMCPVKEHLTGELEQTVREEVEKFRPKIPLIAIDWKVSIKDWSEK